MQRSSPLGREEQRRYNATDLAHTCNGDAFASPPRRLVPLPLYLVGCKPCARVGTAFPRRSPPSPPLLSPTPLHLQDSVSRFRPRAGANPPVFYWFFLYVIWIMQRPHEECSMRMYNKNAIVLERDNMLTPAGVFMISTKQSINEIRKRCCSSPSSPFLTFSPSNLCFCGGIARAEHRCFFFPFFFFFPSLPADCAQSPFGRSGGGRGYGGYALCARGGGGQEKKKKRSKNELADGSVAIGKGERERIGEEAARILYSLSFSSPLFLFCVILD